MVSIKKLVVLFLIPIFLLCELNAEEGSSSKNNTEILLIDPTERNMDLTKNNNQLSGDEWEEHKRIDMPKKKSEFKSPSFFSDFFSIKKTEETTREKSINRAYEEILEESKEFCKSKRLDPEKFGEEFSNQDYKECIGLYIMKKGF